MRKLFLLITIVVFFGCKDKLNLKPDSRLILPKTAKDMENILDNTRIMNVTPSLAQLSSDEYFIPSLAAWQAETTIIGRSAYIWEKDIYKGQTQIQSWHAPFTTIFYCNSVLDIIAKKNIDHDDELKNLKGWALFNRAYSYYALASTYCKAYENTTAGTDLGMPLKLSPNIDELVQRSTLQETFDQIINDVLLASSLLKKDITIEKRNRPSKVAAYALLARVYLSMRKYDQAELYADQSMSLYRTLIDFNSLNPNTISAFTYNSLETIFFSCQLSEFGNTLGIPNQGYGVDTTLLSLYETGDLRKQIYFQLNTVGNYNIKHINSVPAYPFTGLATDELYLIKAECLARRGEVDLAMEFINQLLITRWNPNATTPARPYQNMTAVDADDALDKILTERRKALVWRAIRWTDLKRLNLEGRNIKLTRKLDDQTYVLEPNSPRYVLPIPDDEIALSGNQQNIR